MALLTRPLHRHLGRDAVGQGERTLVGWRTTTEYRDLYPASLVVAAAALAALWLFL